MSGYTAEQKYEAMRMFAAGSSLAEVCAATGIADYSARKLKVEAAEYDGAIEPYVTVAWDIETTDFKADIGMLMISSFVDFAIGIPNTRSIHDFKGSLNEREKQLAMWTCAQLEAADVVVGHNVKAFDRNFLSGVCARHGLPHTPKRQYIDTMHVHQYGVKGKIGNSMENIADVYGLPTPKDKPSKNDWRLYIGGDEEKVKRIGERCEKDIVTTAQMLNRFRLYWHEWKGER